MHLRIMSFSVLIYFEKCNSQLKVEQISVMSLVTHSLTLEVNYKIKFKYRSFLHHYQVANEHISRGQLGTLSCT